MISLKSYLNRSSEDTIPRQVISLLIEKIGSAAVVANEAECAAFRADIDRLRDCIGPESTSETILLTAGSATQALEAYNKSITVLIRKQGRELQDIVNMMTETVATIAGENNRSVKNFRDIGDGLERASAIKDLPTLKLHLGDCLRSFRQETLRQKEQTENVIIALRQEIERGPQRAAVPGIQNLDPATSLPTKEECVKAMHESIPAGKRRYIVTLVVNRIQAINVRFGYEMGNRVLCRFGEFIEQQILPQDRLFRWSGPTLVALLERTETLEQIRTQIRRMLDARLEETCEAEGRSILVPISAAGFAFQLTTTVATAERQIEIFTARQGSRDYI